MTLLSVLRRIRLLWALAVLSNLAIASTALAAKKKAKKATEDPKAAQEQAEERKAPAQFGWTARIGHEDLDLRADQKRDEAIQKLKKLLPTVADGPQKAELLFRLSEMYWGKAKFNQLRAMQIWDTQLEAWHKNSQQGDQPKLESIAELGQGELYRDETLKLYARILLEYPEYPRKDEVLYNLGSANYDAGKKEDGVKRYWELIKQYPDSDFAADAWLQLGEHFFNANKLTQAMKAYGKAAETKKPRIYSYALYKLAWCDYNLQEYDAALTKFREVVEYAKAQKVDDQFKQRDRVQLMEESMSDMVRAYSHLDAVDDAFEYYTTELGKEKAYKYLAKLGRLYDQEGKWAEEIRTFQELNTLYPYSADAPENQTLIMNAYASAGKTDMVRKEVRRLVDLYSPNGTWAKQNAGNQKIVDKAFETVEQELAGLVTEQHRAAQETKLADTYKLARDIYKEYLDKFSVGVNAYKFRFFYAEILFELKEFDASAEQYDLVVAAKPDGEFIKHAGYASILSWEKVAAGVKEEVGKRIEDVKVGKQKGELKKLEKLETLTKGKKYEATELLPAERQLADACDRFVKVAGDDDEVVKVKFKSARLYYIHNQFEEAAARFGEIIDRWPKDALARSSAESILQSFNVREDWAQLNLWSRKFREHKLLMADAKFASEVNQLVEGATFNEIHFVFEPTEAPLQIAERYSTFVGEFPKSKYAMVALYNAIVNFDKSNVLEKAIATADRTLKDYKDFTIADKDLDESKREGASLPKPEEIREKALFLAASFYERIAEFDRAAGLYEQYADEFKDGPRRADALFNAAVFREGLGQLDRALKNFERYVTDFPKKEDVPVIAWRMGLIVEKQKDHKRTQDYFAGFGRYSRSPERLLCADWMAAEALAKQGKTADAQQAYTGLLESYKKLSEGDRTKPCALKAAAGAAFNLLEPKYDSYRAIKLTGVDEKKMAENLLKKLQLVEELQKAYTGVLGIGAGDYGIAALYRVGAVYQHLAQEIFATPCPKRLDEDQCMIYQAALQEKAFPLEERAIEAYDKALAKAYELGLYNDWLAKAQEALKGYEAAKFPDIHAYELIASEVTFEVPQLVGLRP